MEHQDWTQVTFKKKKIVSSSSSPKKQLPPGASLIRDLDSDMPPVPPKTHLQTRMAMQKARLSKRLSQKDLAKKMGIKPSDITDYESGKLPVPKSILINISKVLGVKL